MNLKNAFTSINLQFKTLKIILGLTELHKIETLIKLISLMIVLFIFAITMIMSWYRNLNLMRNETFAMFRVYIMSQIFLNNNLNLCDEDI